MRTRCPCCGTTASLDVLVAHEDARAALGAVFQISQPLGTALVRYLSLFRPATRELTMARVATLVTELLPNLRSNSIPRKGRDWQVTPADWCAAIDQMMQARDTAKLTLPLNGHGYLLEVLASQSDKAERVQEQTQEAQRRERTSTTVPGRATDITALLAGVAIPAAPPPRAPGTSPLVRRMKEQLKGATP